MQVWKDYQEKNKDRFLDELLALLRIPSVSARSEHKADMVKCAEAVKQSVLEAGADMAEIIPTEGHPIVYGEKIIDPNLPPYSFTVTMMCSRPIRLTSGKAVPLIRSSKTGKSMQEDLVTTRDSFICT
jgi:hypothetical protein